ncbi:hypothetical protein BH09PSE1_BH09PSE1_16220 [soil metagenome]
MLLLALLISGLSSPLAEPSGQVYAPPVVRPYEPPSNFGRQIAEGDADATVRTRPIAAPVAVEAYRDTYEPVRSPREISYEQGVEAARIAQNRRMGPLDGSWRVTDAQGQTVMNIVLSDPGNGGSVEGAWNLASSDRMGAIDAVVADGDDRVVTASIDGGNATLRLKPSANGWTGSLTGMGHERGVNLTRPQP